MLTVDPDLLILNLSKRKSPSPSLTRRGMSSTSNHKTSRTFGGPIDFVPSNLDRNSSLETGKMSIPKHDLEDIPRAQLGRGPHGYTEGFTMSGYLEKGWVEADHVVVGFGVRNHFEDLRPCGFHDVRELSP